MFLGFFALDCVLDITCGINYTAQLFSFSSDVTSFELQAVVQLGFYALFSPKTGGFPFFFFPPCPSCHLIHPRLAAFFTDPWFLLSFDLASWFSH